MAAKKFSVKPVLFGLLGVSLLFGAVFAYCLLAAPEPVAGFTQRTSLELAHACGVHTFDPPVSTDKARVLQVTDLPEGSYIYTGIRPSQSTPRWVVVNPGGSITWLDWKAPKDFSPPQPSVKTAGSVTGSKGKKTPTTQDDGETHYETYSYPKIKWQAKPLDNKGAVAQLWTTYDHPEPGQEGIVKFRLTVFKAPDKRARRIQLLDEGGFKILEFKASDFQDVPGTQLMEARESFPCSEDDYRQVRDYAIN